MPVLTRPWGALNYADDGPQDGAAVVFSNSLGTDLRLWDALLPLLPPGLRLIRYDKRGHGLSDGSGPFTIADLAEDAAALVAALELKTPVFVGLSIGGLIGQALAAAHPGLLRGLVISNSAAKVGTAESWQARIASVEAGGPASIADAVMERWFAPPFRATPALRLWRNMLARTDAQGYIHACAALAAADLTASTATLRLPALLIAGSEDGATPPAIVEATARLIPGAAYHCIPGAGHLPCVETPAAHAALIAGFLKDINHV